MKSEPIHGYVQTATGAVVVEGPDAATFLQGLISQDVEAATESLAVRSFLLGPRGKFRALIWMVRAGEKFWLFTDSPDNLIADLRRFHLRVDCSIEPYAGPVVDVIGSQPDLPDADLVAQIPWRGTTRWVITGIEASTLDVPELTEDVWTRIRIEAGEPQMDRDVDESTIPQESGLVASAVSFTKGCYLGQELVARIDTRGHVNKRLVMLRSSDLMADGASVATNDGAVGVISSAAPSADGAVALAVLPASIEGEVSIGDAKTSATVVELV